MKLLKLLAHHAPNRMFMSIVLGALSGVCYSSLIPLVQMGIASLDGASSMSDTLTVFGFDLAHSKLAAVFFGMCVFVLVTRSISQVTLLRVAMDVTTELRKSMYSQISRAPIADLERMGSAKLIATITTDVGRIIMGARALPDLLVSGVTIVGMLGFLAYLNFSVFVFVMEAIAFGVVTYQVPVLIANRYFQRSRQHVDLLQESIQGLIGGAKELKLDANKRARYFSDVLLASEYAVLAADKAGSTVIRLAANYGDMISFFAIGMIAFVSVNYHAISSSELTGVVMAMLYITTPIALVINTVPTVVMARISLNKVNEVIREIPSEPEASHSGEAVPWDVMTLKSLYYQHKGGNGDAGFRIGPIDLELRRGEVTFIVGGNGSGKSTLSKIITLHYSAQEGDILFDGERLTTANLSAYRQRIGAIYSDYYLFDRLLCERSPREDELLEQYMVMLRLDGKLAIKDRKFTTTALSDGQRKRLALLSALLDDKDLYLFDEWAADQDPSFKSIFYRRIIHELKNMGKTVVVISHDDRYFGEADRLIFMEQGSVRDVADKKKSDMAPLLAGNLA